ncbi:MAG: TIGR00153 family protein [Myxococcales bacterium]|jgi:predicted phosphate transport protein (TIGR00153 family)|nr:TIGR00153 family protein [Deltaproteobacteria bacterium]NOQ82574.1 TIGR00153 family protein [Myxococcales bacterium]MBW2189286.1 TIGR00153 family protein [Deltaproteobacteria bacterium]MBW2402716.1 TIGR00153 family protein [Deltaproteobacteria bacterium]MBW2547991.1 TIGR00153 family protein [Deltaproteobacteria bacterium]
MRIPLANLLARNPLPKVGDLMVEVMRTSDRVQDLIELLAKGDQAGVERLAKEISAMEGKADDAKNAARSKMPVRLMMPVDRRDVLKLISEMDAIADCAEDVGVLLTIRPLTVPDEMKPVLQLFVQSALDTVHEAAKLIDLIDDLVESGFSGPPAERVLEQSAILGRAEHEADKIQDQCAKVLFKEEDNMPPAAVFMWTKVLNKIGDMANHAENVGDQFRLFVAG